MLTGISFDAYPVWADMVNLEVVEVDGQVASSGTKCLMKGCSASMGKGERTYIQARVAVNQETTAAGMRKCP